MVFSAESPTYEQNEYGNLTKGLRATGISALVLKYKVIGPRLSPIVGQAAKKLEVSTMEKNLGTNDTDQNAAEEQLFELIKQAGDEARIRKKEAMARHFERLRAAVEEGVLQRRGPVST